MSGTVVELLKLYDSPSYLEIGVEEGFSFHRAIAQRKVAVDPVFRFNVNDAQLDNPNASYYECTSDEFFSFYKGAPFDVVYIDGLHTSEQTLRDLLNVMSVTTESSTIVIDDIGPNSYAASLLSKEEMWTVNHALGSEDPSWMGDVYKLVYFIDTFMQSYSFASPIGGNPQLVLWKQPRQSVAERTLKVISEMSFFDYVQQIDVKNPRSIDEIIERIKESRKL